MTVEARRSCDKLARGGGAPLLPSPDASPSSAPMTHHPLLLHPPSHQVSLQLFWVPRLLRPQDNPVQDLLRLLLWLASDRRRAMAAHLIGCGVWSSGAPLLTSRRAGSARPSALLCPPGV